MICAVPRHLKETVNGDRRYVVTVKAEAVYVVEAANAAKAVKQAERSFMASAVDEDEGIDSVACISIKPRRLKGIALKLLMDGGFVDLRPESRRVMLVPHDYGKD